MVADEPVPAVEALAHVRVMLRELADLCLGAGRGDVALSLLQASIALQRPAPVQPPDAKAAPGDAA